MRQFYANVSPARSSHHQMQPVNAAPYSPIIPHQQLLLSCDEMIKNIYSDNDRRLHDDILRFSLPDPETKRCSGFVNSLRVHRNLFVHTYVHLISCCNSKYLHLLVENVNIWSRWRSVQQLTHHSLIRNKLLSFLLDYPCRQHRSLCTRNLAISDDESDLLCNLLYCCKKPELYGLPEKPAIQGYELKESEQVIELLWQFIIKLPKSEIAFARRLHASIYRLARKSAYLPHDLQITYPSISNQRSLGAGANSLVTQARLNGHDVVIKKILCGDRATQKKCLEMFAGEAILWKTLRHKNIVPFLGVVTEATFNMGLVSPFYRNGNIRSYMRRYNPPQARDLARDLAEGLEYIHYHEPPIIHGDLKGDNVLVDNDGHARLGDFGQSHASDSGKYLDSTRVGLATYNPVHWMAPEIMDGGDHVKASDKSDIFSFGCVLYEIMSGKIPFENIPFGQVVRFVTNGERPSMPQSICRDDPLWKIAKSCWEHHPENRPSAVHLVSFLR